MAEYKIREQSYRERLLEQHAEAAEEDEQAAVERLAHRYRSIIDSQDVRNGGSIHASAAFWNGLVLFGSADKHFYALDKQTGRLMWKFLTGDAIASSAFVDGDRVFFGSYDGYIYALRVADGSLVWKYKTGDLVFSSPTVAHGIVYVGSADTYLYALRADDGTPLWKFKTGALATSSARVIGSTVFFGSEDWNVYALDSRTGKLKWQFRATGIPTEMTIATRSGHYMNKTHRAPIETSEPAIVCFGTWGSNHIYMLDAQTGRLLSHNRSPAETPAQPYFYKGILYFGSADQHLYAVEPESGRVVWKFYTGGMITSSSWVQDGVIYFGSYDQHLYAADIRDGRPRWKFRTDGVITASPVIDGSVLYFGSWDTYFYAVDIERRELLWKFKTAAPPCKPSFIQGISTLGRIKQAIFRWWKPELPRLTVYDARLPSMADSVSAGQYKSEIGYKSEVGYKSNGPAGYETNRKKKDWRDPWGKR